MSICFDLVIKVIQGRGGGDGRPICLNYDCGGVITKKGDMLLLVGGAYVKLSHDNLEFRYHIRYVFVLIYHQVSK